MALRLVVTSTFPGYPRGTIVSDPGIIASIRASDYAGQVVLVSDTVIPPPDPPPVGGGSLDVAYQQLLSLYNGLSSADVQQQSAISALLSVNTSQTQAISSLSQQITTLNTSVSALAAKIANPNGGNPIPANLADDLPLAENDGVVLATNGEAVLAGDIR